MVYYNPYYAFANCLDIITNDCIHKLKTIKKNKPQEPDITATLVTDFPNLANSLFSFTRCKFGGCFVHQSPKVEFKDSVGNNATCEAGDLLVLCRRKESGMELYNAALFQLKKHSLKSTIHKITNTKEKIQLELYQKWPFLELLPNRTKHDIFPKTITSGGQYLYIVNNVDIRPYPYTLLPSMPIQITQLNLFYTWGIFLMDFIQWRTGRPISKESDASNDEWSKFIWELINSSRNNVYNRKNIGHTNAHRANGDFFSLMLEHNPILFNDTIRNDTIRNDGVRGEKHQEMEMTKGISILFIDVSEDGLR